MGFTSEPRSRSDASIGDILAKILPQDLLKYGLIPEFVGQGAYHPSDVRRLER